MGMTRQNVNEQRADEKTVGAASVGEKCISAAVADEKTVDEKTLGDVCILGVGKTGVAVAQYLLDLPRGTVRSITMYGGTQSGAHAREPQTHEAQVHEAHTHESQQQQQPADDPLQNLADAGVRLVLGTDEVKAPANVAAYNLTITSPGIPPFSRFYQTAASCSKTMIGEPEFAWRQSPDKWIGITGTNGKTTTTTLIAALLQQAGLLAKAVGNIGTLSIANVAKRPADEWFVAELSSFQLAETQHLHPRVAILLNITPDHLSWHKTLQNYVAAKERIFAQLDAGDLAVISSDSNLTPIVERLHKRGLRVCICDTAADPHTPCAAFVAERTLYVRLDAKLYALLGVDELTLKGTHNIQNVLAACACALDLGLSVESICQTLRSFSPLEHRIEPVATDAAGIHYINDSKATNTDAVVKALTAFPKGKVILLAGGHDKHTELTEFNQAVLESCKAVVCFGEAASRLSEALSTYQEQTQVSGQNQTSQQDQRQTDDPRLRIEHAKHLADALQQAIALAHKGDYVLLSPACSSFDEFSGYEERGCVFKQLVMQHVNQHLNHAANSDSETTSPDKTTDNNPKECEKSS